MVKKSRFQKDKSVLKERTRAMSRVPKTNGLNAILKDIDNLPVWEPSEVGEYTLSIFPYEQTSEYNPDFAGETIKVEEGLCHFRRIFGVHWINGKAYTCPKLTYGKNCPVCDSESEVWDAWKEAGKPKGDEGKPFFDKINKEIQPQEYVAIVADITDDKDNTERKLFISKYSKYNKHIDFIMSAMAEKSPEGKNDEEKKACAKAYAQIRKKFNAEKFDGKDIELFYYFDERFNLVFDVELCGDGQYAHKALSGWKSIDFVESEDIEESVIDTIPKLDNIFVVKEYKELKEIWDAGEEDEVIEEDTPIHDGAPLAYENEEENNKVKVKKEGLKRNKTDKVEKVEKEVVEVEEVAETTEVKSDSNEEDAWDEEEDW